MWPISFWFTWTPHTSIAKWPPVQRHIQGTPQSLPSHKCVYSSWAACIPSGHCAAGFSSSQAAGGSLCSTEKQLCRSCSSRVCAQMHSSLGLQKDKQHQRAEGQVHLTLQSHTAVYKGLPSSLQGQ